MLRLLFWAAAPSPSRRQSAALLFSDALRRLPAWKMLAICALAMSARSMRRARELRPARNLCARQAARLVVDVEEVKDDVEDVEEEQLRVEDLEADVHVDVEGDAKARRLATTMQNLVLNLAYGQNLEDFLFAANCSASLARAPSGLIPTNQQEQATNQPTTC